MYGGVEIMFNTFQIEGSERLASRATVGGSQKHSEQKYSSAVLLSGSVVRRGASGVEVSIHAFETSVVIHSSSSND